MNKEIDQHKRMIDILKESLDKIYDSTVSVTKAYNTEYVPLNLLWEITQKAKLKKTKVKGAKELMVNYNKTMDVLYTCAVSYCDTNDLNKKLPMVVLRQYLDQIKDNL